MALDEALCYGWVDSLLKSIQKQYIIWINMAKRAETIRKRVDESIRLLEKGQELGLK